MARSLAQVLVYPNPFTSRLLVSAPSDFDYELVDPTGKTCAKGKANATVELGEGLVNGMYLLKITQSGRSKWWKVLKQ